MRFGGSRLESAQARHYRWWRDRLPISMACRFGSFQRSFSNQRSTVITKARYSVLEYAKGHIVKSVLEYAKGHIVK
jgi:hypothetical protein